MGIATNLMRVLHQIITFMTNNDIFHQCWEILTNTLESWLEIASPEQQRQCLDELARLRGYEKYEVAICRMFGEVAVSQGNLVDANLYLSKGKSHI